MRPRRMANRLFFLVLTLIPLTLWTKTFTVTDTSDSGPGTLRQAIMDANANPGLDLIAFNISGSGVHTLTPLSALPAISDPVIIDGYTQPGASPNTNGPGLGDNAVLLIELNGVNTSGASGQGGLIFYIGSGGSTVRGLVINRCKNNGIELSTTGGHNTIQGNFIGTDPLGSTALSNQNTGIYLETVSTSYNESHDLIGGIAPADRNVISGNVLAGIVLSGGDSSVVQGNFIGTNAAGIGGIPGSQAGISFVGSTSYNTIGGTTPEARNIISGNSDGIAISNTLSNPNIAHNIVEGNYIGTDLTGKVALGNQNNGIVIAGQNNLIGGTAPGAGNVISGNGASGIWVEDGDTSMIQGNLIGTDVSGALPLGNLGRGGVDIGAFRVLLGGTTPGAGNTIAFNGAASPIGGGVIVDGGQGNAILGNSIYANTNTTGTLYGLGIDLGGNGVTPNTPGGPHFGVNNPNFYQNYPLLSSANSDGSTTTIKGTLNSAPSTTFRVEFFADSVSDPSGYGEGQTFLGFKNVTTGIDSNATFTFGVTRAVPLGFAISATATDTGNNTSEFSHCIIVQPATSVRENPGKIPSAFALLQNYPNPFNPTTKIQFTIVNRQLTIVKVYDVLGSEVATLVNEVMEPGTHTVQFDGSGLASGVYFYRLQAGNFVQTKSLVLLR